MKTRSTHKVIAIFLTLNFLTTLLPMNMLFANTNGPKAPEAASFEPVDATDMVNLVTGDFTYVLPLLNVPSPEGGYPLSLAYHAGIAMDQEASWVGLGWNLNPGAINRSVNGYPDDYNSSLLTEYFYDEGGQSDVYSLSIGYGIGAASAGLGFSWGSDRAFGGAVNIGYGFGDGQTGGVSGNLSIGTNGVSLGVGATGSGGLSLGLNASSNGNIGGSVGFDNNSAGFAVGYSSQGGFSGGISVGDRINGGGFMDVDFSSSGIGFSYGVRQKKNIGTAENPNSVIRKSGVGLSLAFNNSVSMGDYTTKTSGWMIPVFVPIGPGFLSLSFGKQTFKYYLGERENNYVTGPLNFNADILGNHNWEVYYGLRNDGYDGNHLKGIKYKRKKYFNTENEAINYWNSIKDTEPSNDALEYALIHIIPSELDRAFLDMYEFSLTNNDIEDITDRTKQNLSFPSYDVYNVQAQGISGNISAKLWENGVLFGLSNKETEEDYILDYTYDSSNSNLPEHVKFSGDAYFQFDNEINTYLGVNPANLDPFEGIVDDVFHFKRNPGDLYTGGVDNNPLDRRVTSSHVDYFTNAEIVDGYSNDNSVIEGYLGPNMIELDRTLFPPDGIGAFQITAADGKTYHYSLPVYNHETVVRTFGVVENSPLESESYIEKRQLDPYATHWLLTAVTGPDYMDDGDNVADEGDLGYWVSFDYGKWSEAFVWKTPYGKTYLENPENEDIKTWIRGRKELYYLDAVKTRTHTAVFVKSERLDAPSPSWSYRAVNHVESNLQNNNSNLYNSANGLRFTIPSQNQLKLDKIVLFKNEDFEGLGYDKNTSGTAQSSVYIEYNESEKPGELANYNRYQAVYDNTDNIGEAGALKVIQMGYNDDDYLKTGMGSLSLNQVTFKGRSGIQLMPPYSFDYNNRLYGTTSYTFDIEDKDGWGYHKDDNSLWSLNEITTPQGGKIQIDYEEHDLIPVIKSTIKFSENNDDFKLEKISETEYEISAKYDLGLELNETVNFVSKDAICRDIFTNYQKYLCQKQEIPATITSINGNNIYTITLQNAVDNCGCTGASGYLYYTSYAYAEIDYVGRVVENSGGIRVASITTTNGAENYKTEYEYGDDADGNGAADGIGYVSYLPYTPELQEEIPYAQELPAPKVMYEYVTMKTFDIDGQQVNGKTVYKFNVLKNKDDNKVKFGDFFEIDAVNSEDSTFSNGGNPIYNYTGEYTIKDNLAAIGQLLEVSVYNKEAHLLSKIVNHYYDPDETPNLLGVTQESYQNYKSVTFNDTDDLWNIGTASTRVTYPSLSKGTTEYRGGYIYDTTYSEIDENVGQATVIETTNSENQGVRSTAEPAYTKYLDMASKLNNVNNKHMLTQEALTFTELNNGGNWKKVSAGITSWKPFAQVLNSTIDLGPITINYTNEKDIWRKHKTYVWDGAIDENGLFTYFSGDDDNFDWSLTATSQPSDWKQLSEITSYNNFSFPLEVKDINDNYAATKTCDEDTKIMATANAAHNEMHYSGAEYVKDGLFDGAIDDTGRTSSRAHTGEWCIGVSSAQGFKTTLSGHDAGRYKISVWSSKEHYQNARVFDGNSLKEFNGEIIPAGDWVLLNHYVYLTETDKTIYVRASSGTIYYDDFRIHPVQSSMTSYVYNQWDELTHILGSNNMATRFEYDTNGRLLKTHTEVADDVGLTGGFKTVSENHINYKTQ